MPGERIRNRDLAKKVMGPDEAAALVSSGMTIATSGAADRGFPAGFFRALAGRAQQGLVKELTLVTSSLMDRLEGWLAESGALKKRLGSYSNASLRKLINAGSTLR